MTISVVGMKLCAKCGVEKSFDDFQKNRARRDGIETYCRECNNTRHRGMYASDPTATIARTRKYHVDHPEWSKRVLAEWHQKNKDARYDRVKTRLENDPEFRVYRRRVGIIAGQVRRARMADVEVEEISAKQYDQILQTFNNQCWICAVELDIVFWDHVHPIAKGGSHTKGNLRPACVSCNARKSATWPFTDEMKIKIADDVRALRTPQEHTNPVRDGLEVKRACHS